MFLAQSVERFQRLEKDDCYVHGGISCFGPTSSLFLLSCNI